MWLAILVGALIAVPFGLLVALPSLRIGDLYLALLTLGFALVIEQVVWQRPEYDNFGAGLKIARPFGLQITDRVEMYAIVAVVFAVVGLLIINMKRATSGLVFAAIRSSEPASMTSGISIVRAKLVLFGISAFVAGLGGALYATVVGSATPKSFNALVGIVWLAIVVTWGVRSVTGALLAGMIYAIAPQRLSIILVLVFFLVVGSLFTELALKQAYRKVFGALAMTILAVVAFGGSAWIWDNVNNDDSVSVILVLLGLGAAALVARGVMKAPISNRPVQLGLVVVIAALGVWAAVALAGLDLGESASDVPTMLFGLGAIGLVSEPAAWSTTSSTVNDCGSSGTRNGATRKPTAGRTRHCVPWRHRHERDDDHHHGRRASTRGDRRDRALRRSRRPRHREPGGTRRRDRRARRTERRGEDHALRSPVRAHPTQGRARQHVGRRRHPAQPAEPRPDGACRAPSSAWSSSPS